MKRMACFVVLLSILAAPLSAQSPLLRPPSNKFPQASPIVWDERSAAHLMRRAGFSASPQQLEQLAAQGFDLTLDRLLNYEAVDDSKMEAGLRDQNYQLSRTNQMGVRLANALEMNRWWFYRMIHSERQLLEKMTLFWHDHFATSVAEIRFVQADGTPLMMVQQETLRRNALGNFKTMVHEIARDPSMVVWLDNHLNVKDSPNENWARELMELFTMGVDQYTQEDVEEAARAFTGWSVRARATDMAERNFNFVFRPEQHDFGFKTVLGQTGNWDGDDVIDIIFQQEVAAEFIARKIWEFLVYPEPSQGLVKELGRVFRESGYEIRTLLGAVFRHPEFFSERGYRALMKSPVEMVANFMREMELKDPYFVPFFLESMNQVLFAPPDVGGWTSGVGWVNTSTLIFRYNFVNTQLLFREGLRVERRLAEAVDFPAIIEKYQLSNEGDVVDHFVFRFLQGDATPDERMALEEYLLRGDDGLPMAFDLNDPLTVDKKVRGLAYLAALLPAYQLN